MGYKMRDVRYRLSIYVARYTFRENRYATRKRPRKSLFEQLSDRIMTTGSKIIPELFRFIATDDDAKLMLATPGTVDELAEKTGEKE